MNPYCSYLPQSPVRPTFQKRPSYSWSAPQIPWGCLREFFFDHLDVMKQLYLYYCLLTGDCEHRANYNPYEQCLHFFGQHLHIAGYRSQRRQLGVYLKHRCVEILIRTFIVPQMINSTKIIRGIRSTPAKKASTIGKRRTATKRSQEFGTRSEWCKKIRKRITP